MPGPVVGDLEERGRLGRAVGRGLARRRATRMRVPGVVCVSALSSRTRRIWATRCASQSASTSAGARRGRRPRSSRRPRGRGRGELVRRSVARAAAARPARARARASRRRAARGRAGRSSSFCSRSTCSRIVARNSARVSSSSSSSWSSSTNPPSEKIGVRSSCEAFAMNSLRAWSSRASLRCISLKATRELAELVLGVDRDRVGEVARRDLAGRALEALDAPREHARRVVAARHRDDQRDHARRSGSGAGSGRRCPARRRAARRRRPPRTGLPR